MENPSRPGPARAGLPRLGMISLPASLSAAAADPGAPIRQIAADAYEAIKAIANTAMEKIQNSSATNK